MKRNFRDGWVLVTGASSGLGEEMALQLARDHGANIVAVARREERLRALKLRIEKDFGRKVDVVTADMTKKDDVNRAFNIATTDRDLRGVILNAGVTYFGSILEQTDESIEGILTTNAASVAKLSVRFANHFRKNHDGGIMLISSMAGFSPIPLQTTYAASKAFVTSFGRSLAHELRSTGVDLTVFAPGGIATEMLELSGLSKGFGPKDPSVMAVDTCARYALAAFLRGEELAIPGIQNALIAIGMKLLPHSVVKGIFAKIYEKAL